MVPSPPSPTGRKSKTICEVLKWLGLEAVKYHRFILKTVGKGKPNNFWKNFLEQFLNCVLGDCGFMGLE